MRIHPTKTLIQRAVNTAKKTFWAQRWVEFRLSIAALVAGATPETRDELIRESPDKFGKAGEHLSGAYTAFCKNLDKLVTVYDLVSRWWVFPSAPTFEERATSALEGMLWCAMRLKCHIDCLGPDALNREVVWSAQIVSRFCDGSSDLEQTIQSELRRETAGILAACRERTLVPIPALTKPSEGICDACFDEAVAHGLCGWENLTDDERWKVVSGGTSAKRQESNPRPGGEERPAVATLATTNPDCLSLRVLQQVKHLPSAEAVKLVRGLLDVFPGALGLKGVEAIQPGGNKILTALVKDDPLWRAAIYLPGKRGGGGYRIRTEQEAQAELIKPQTLCLPKKATSRSARRKAA